MRRPRSRSFEDLDAVDVLLLEDEEEDAAADEVRTVLHELALEAMARRATWAGETETPPDPAATDADPAPHGLARRLARRYRGRAVTAAVLAAAVVTTTAVVDARQTAARAAALAASPAVLAEVSGPPAEVWRVPGRLAGDGAGTLLVVDGTSLRAVDPATGAGRWTASAAAQRAAAAGACLPVDEDLWPGRAPVEDATGPRGLVACVPGLPGGGPPQPGDPDGEPSGDGVDHGVVVLDAATGRTRHTVVPDGALLLAEPVARDLLVVAALPEGAVRATRWDLATGTPRWTSTGPHGAHGALAGGAVDAVERRPGSLTVGGFAVDLATGEPLDAEHEGAKPYPYEEHALPRGARATWSWRDDGTSGRGLVRGGDSGRSYGLPGPPLRPRVSDGSDAVLVVRTARGDRLRGVDLRTGRLHWSRADTGTRPLRATALVDGVLLLDDGTTTTALDVRTGTDLWRADAHTPATDGVALTDGRVVLLPVASDDGRLDLVARRIADGTVEWSTGLPAGTVSVTVVDHRLVAQTRDGVVGLG